MKALLIALLLLVTSCFQSSSESSVIIDEKFEKEVSKSVDSVKEEYTIKIGKIADVDGFSNLRERPTINSKVIGKIYLDQYFFYSKINSKWCSVITLDGMEGFIHKSRVSNANSEELICAVINNSDPSDKSFDKDTILHFSDLKDNSGPYIRKLLYPLMEKKVNISDGVQFQNKHAKVEITKQKLDPSDYVVESNGVFSRVLGINGEYLFGSNGNPKYVFEDFRLTFGELEWEIAKDSLYSLLDPSFENIKIYVQSNKQIVVSMTGAENNASESYQVLFFLNEVKLLKKYVYRGF